MTKKNRDRRSKERQLLRLAKPYSDLFGPLIKKMLELCHSRLNRLEPTKPTVKPSISTELLS